MKLVSKLAIAATLAASIAVADLKSASAAIINYMFTVDSPTLTGKGFFTFDDETFSDDNIPVAPVQSLTFQFDGDSIIYTEQDDTEFPDFPVVFPTSFLTGTSSIGLDYLFNDANPASDLSYEIIGEDFTIFSRTSPNAEIITGRVSYQRVPEPATLAGAVLVCSLGWMVKKKGTSLSKVKA